MLRILNKIKPILFLSVFGLLIFVIVDVSMKKESFKSDLLKELEDLKNHAKESSEKISELKAENYKLNEDVEVKSSLVEGLKNHWKHLDNKNRNSYAIDGLGNSEDYDSDGDDDKYDCNISKQCPETHMPYRIKSGTANLIGPSICVNGKDIIRPSATNIVQNNNVVSGDDQRGFYIVIVDGSDGQLVRKGIYDLYGYHDSELLKMIKNDLLNSANDRILIATSFDDASRRLSKETRDVLKNTFNFQGIEKLDFRDNFVYVGNKNNVDQVFSKIVKFDQDSNKYGNWPAQIEVEGCIEKK